MCWKKVHCFFFKTIKFFINSLKNLYKYVFFHTKETNNNKLFLVSLPNQSSKKIKNYKDSIDYAGYSGEVCDQSLLCNKIGLEILHPYKGYKFLQLAKHCDPYIFCNKVNKACLRYAVKDLLPREILENKVKTGQPGVTENKVFETNKSKIIAFLNNHNSELVSMETLREHILNDKFNQNEFLALSLVVFEDILNTKYNLRPKIN